MSKHFPVIILYSRWIWSCLQGSLGEILSTTTRYCGCKDSERLDIKLLIYGQTTTITIESENFSTTHHISVVGSKHFTVYPVYITYMNSHYRSKTYPASWWSVWWNRKSSIDHLAEVNKINVSECTIIEHIQNNTTNPLT